jgi:hypothetical protein
VVAAVTDRDRSAKRVGEPHSLPPLVTPVILFGEEIVNGANFFRSVI